MRENTLAARTQIAYDWTQEHSLYEEVPEHVAAMFEGIDTSQIEYGPRGYRLARNWKGHKVATDQGWLFYTPNDPVLYDWLDGLGWSYILDAGRLENIYYASRERELDLYCVEPESGNVTDITVCLPEGYPDLPKTTIED